MPRPVVDRPNGDMNKILKQKEMDEDADRGCRPPARPSSSTNRFKEIEQWRQVVARAKIKIN
jgi:hypothetical protein